MENPEFEGEDTATNEESSSGQAHSDSPTTLPSDETPAATLDGQTEVEDSDTTELGTPSKGSTDTGNFGDVCQGGLTLGLGTAFIESPMELVSNAAWTEIPAVRVSDVANGAVAFPFGASCSTIVYVWGYVYDSNPGAHLSDDSDSFFVGIDESPEATWIYGCNTYSLLSGGFTWQPVGHWPNDWECASQNVSFLLGAGEHILRLRAREPKTVDQTGFAAVAKVFVTTDPSAVP